MNYFYRYFKSINKSHVTNSLLITALLLILVLLGLKFNMTANPIIGDESSFILQALSIANDFDLKYNDKDLEHWKNVGWLKYPYGLFFQKYSGGYAFAKPYSYSLFLAPFLIFFGNKGFIIGNILLLGLINVFTFLSFRSYYGKLASVLLTISFVFFSYVYMYTFFIHPDLFLALLSLIFVFLLTRLLHKPNNVYLFFISLLAALMAAEKIVMILLIIPTISLLFIKIKNFRTVSIFCITFTIGFLLFILPYLHYSDYKAWNPYNGARYYGNPYPFDGNKPNPKCLSVNTTRFFKPGYVLQNLFDISSLKNKARSLHHYFFGAYTGVIVFIPFAFITILYSIFRTIKDPDFQIALPLAGIFSYILFYVILFTDNYYGGGGSLGNRYFLQISPFIIMLVLALKINRINIISMTILSFLLSLMLIYHHHSRPWSFPKQFLKTSYFQKIMPFEINQIGVMSHTRSIKLVNPMLYPSLPRWVHGHFNTIEIEGKRYMVQTEAQCSDRAFSKSEDLKNIFIQTTVNGKKIWVNNGFYKSEGGHIWSNKISSLIIKNTGRKEQFYIKYAFPQETKIIMMLKDKQLILYKHDKVSIDTSEFNNELILIHFKSDKSGIPAEILKNPGDFRELSFALSFGDY